MRTALPLPKYAAVARRHEFYDRVLEEVRALPGVSGAAYISGLPMVMRGMIWAVSIPGQPALPAERRTTSLRFVTPGFFAALDIPLLAGRDVSESDARTSPYVAVVSESFAVRYWPGQDSLGRRFNVQGSERVIVGVVRDIRVRGLERISEPQIYLPSRQVNDGALAPYTPKELVVKTAVAPVLLVPAIRAIVARADPQQPISDIQWLSDIVAGEIAPRRVQVRVLGTFAIVAFLLAGIGLPGLLAYNVSQRTREFGVRLALGADRRSIIGLVMRRGLVLAAIGVLLGTTLALVTGRALQSLLAGVSPTDSLTYAASVSLVVLMTIAGSLLPAVRAIRLNPIDVIRSE